MFAITSLTSGEILDRRHQKPGAPWRRSVLTRITAGLAVCAAAAAFTAAPSGASIVDPGGSGDVVQTDVYCNAVGHTVAVSTTASMYRTHVMRKIWWGRVGGVWQMLDDFRFQNGTTVWPVASLAGYRLVFYAEYTYEGHPGEYPRIYQYYPGIGEFRLSPICYV